MAVGGPAVQVVFDCDPGIDDALAMAVLADAVRSGRAVLQAIVAVGGNVDLTHTAANVGFLSDRFGLDAPTYSGAAEPIAGPVPGDAAHVHGTDGIGGLRRAGSWPMPAPVTPSQLVGVLAELDPAAGSRVLLATGPLTNLAAMCQVDPDLARHLDRVVVMGGAFGDPGGNVTAHAEFNVWIDPEAWGIVAAAGLPLEVVPLDVTTKVVLTRDDVVELTGGRDPANVTTLAASLVSAGIDLYDDLLGTPICEMHDPLAAALIFEPTLAEWVDGSVSVRLEGEERGRTVLDRRGLDRRGLDQGGPLVRVALGIDVAQAHAALIGALAAVTDP
jgi:inosine-uridine nucleoside N-ribohydrolase